MISIHVSTRVFLCSQPIDMRLSFDGLAGMVKAHFNMNPTCGYLFVFFSRRRDRMKLLFWNVDGFDLYYKRLEHRTFAWLDDLDLAEGGEIDASDLEIILAGVNPAREKHSRKKTMTPPVPPLQLV